MFCVKVAARRYTRLFHFINIALFRFFFLLLLRKFMVWQTSRAFQEKLDTNISRNETSNFIIFSYKRNCKSLELQLSCFHVPRSHQQSKVEVPLVITIFIKRIIERLKVATREIRFLESTRSSHHSHQLHLSLMFLLVNELVRKQPTKLGIFYRLSQRNQKRVELLLCLWKTKIKYPA